MLQSVKSQNEPTPQDGDGDDDNKAGAEIGTADMKLEIMEWPVRKNRKKKTVPGEKKKGRGGEDSD